MSPIFTFFLLLLNSHKFLMISKTFHCCSGHTLLSFFFLGKVSVHDKKRKPSKRDNLVERENTKRSINKENVQLVKCND